MDAYDGNARMKGATLDWLQLFFLLMADREEDAASARAGVEEDRRASLNEERERER